MSPEATASPAREQELLAAAQKGDEHAYQQLVEPRRSELQAHCYRMLGSTQDAEDALQEALLRAWKGLSRFEGRSSLRSWLYTIATNTCLNAIERRPKRVLPIDYGPAADPHLDPRDAPIVEGIWLEPLADERLALEDGPAGPDARYEQREAVELAFIAALQHLPPKQRAALILRDVLGFSAKETAIAMETSVASANSALQRARAAADEKLPERSQQETLRELGDEKLAEIVAAYMDAMDRGDVGDMVAMLTDDATWSMPPMTCWFHGTEAVANFLTIGPGQERWKRRATRANGQIAIGGYMWSEPEEMYAAFAVDVLTLRGDKVAAVTAFLDGSLFERFGLPDSLPA